MEKWERRLRRGLLKYADWYFSAVDQDLGLLQWHVLRDGSEADDARKYLVEELGIYRDHANVAMSLLMEGSKP